MKIFVIVILSLIAMSIMYSAFMKKKFEVTLPLSIFTAILIIYIFGLCGHLKMGVYVFLGIAGVGFVVGVLKSIATKEFKLLIKNLFSVGFFIFIGAVIFICYMTNGRLLSKFDEFTHWGLTIKNYMIFDGFANIAGSTTHGAGYQPGISVFCYLFTALKETFSESDALRAMNVYIVAMLLPIFRKISWKRIIIGIIMIPIIFVLPWLFNYAITPYNTLYADAALAVTFAYLLFGYFSNGQSVSNYISMGLASAVLILAKPSSEVFALAIILLVIVDILAFGRKDFKEMLSKKGGWYGFTFYIVISVASYLSWKIFTNVNHMLQVFDYIEVSGEKTQSASSIIHNFINALLSQNGNEKLSIPYVWWIVIFIGLGFFAVILIKDKQDKKRTILYCALLIVGYIGFLASLCFMYIYLFIPAEGASLASMDRYVCTFILGVCIFFVYAIIDGIFQRFDGFGTILVIIPVALILLFAPLSKINTDMITCKQTIKKTQKTRKKYKVAEATFAKMDYKNDRVYFISQNTHGLDYQIAYYLGTPVSLSYDYEMGWSLGKPYDEKDIWTLDMTKEEWEQALIDGDYTYVYLYKTDDQFINRYESLFENKEDISNNTCFKITKNKNHITLEKAFAK